MGTTYKSNLLRLRDRAWKKMVKKAKVKFNRHLCNKKAEKSVGRQVYALQQEIKNLKEQIKKDARPVRKKHPFYDSVP